MKLFLSLLFFFLLSSSLFSQVRLTGKGTGNTISITNDLPTMRKIAKDSLNERIGADGVTVNELITDTLALERTARSTAIKDSLSTLFVADTAALKLLSLQEGRGAFLLALSGTNSNGYGYYTQVDSAYPEGYKGTVFASTVSGKQWVANNFLETNSVNILNFGAYSDSTNSSVTKTAIQNAVKFARKINSDLYLPAGKFLISGEISMQAATYTGRGITVKGAGKTKTFIYLDGDPTGLVAHFGGSANDFTNNDSLYNDFEYSDMTLVGNKPLNTSDGVTAGDGGIYHQYNSGASPRRMFAHNLRFIKCGLGLQLKGLDTHVRVTNCEFLNSDWVGLTPAGNTVEVDNCFFDSLESGIECYAVTGTSVSPDSNGLIVISNNVLKNINYYGMAIYAWTSMILDGNQLYGNDGAYAGDRDGLLLRWSPTYIRGFFNGRSAIISNNVIRNFRNRGITMDIGTSWASATEADSIIDNVLISNNIISNNRISAVGIELDAAKYLKVLKISSNEFINNNIENALSQCLSLYLNKVNNAHIVNNTIRKDTSDAINSVHPICLLNCDSTEVVQNDFYTLYGEPYLWCDSTSVKTLNAYNNKGLSIRGVYDFNNTTRYYQQSLVYRGGTLVGGYPSTIGFLQTIINNDSLCSVKYDASGAAVDTVNIRN